MCMVYTLYFFYIPDQYIGFKLYQCLYIVYDTPKGEVGFGANERIFSCTEQL